MTDWDGEVVEVTVHGSVLSAQQIADRVRAALYGPEFFAGRSPLVEQSASVVVPLIIEETTPRSVVDIGCGKGEWMTAFADHGCDVFGVDISAPDGPMFLQHDLTMPLELGRRFDVVVCLETAEHLPEDAADTLVDSIVAHADTVVFSGAIVGQAGIGHVNCQPHDYWHGKFAARGYEMSDPFRPRLLGDGRVSPWYQANTFLYTKASA